MEKRVKVYVRNVLWQEVTVYNKTDRFTFQLKDSIQTVYQDTDLINNNFETITFPIQTYTKQDYEPYTNEPFINYKYKIEIDDPEIYIYDEKTIVRRKDLRQNNYYCSEKIESKEIENRFEILDL